MATYKDIADYVKNNFEMYVSPCEISQVKKLHGCKMRKNSKPMGTEKKKLRVGSIAPIENALRHYKIIS